MPVDDEECYEEYTLDDNDAESDDGDEEDYDDIESGT